MNNAQTIEKMNEIKLYGMARDSASAFEMGIDYITPDEFAAHLIDAEYDDRHERRFKRLPGLDTGRLWRRLTLPWIEIYLKTCF